MLYKSSDSSNAKPVSFRILLEGSILACWGGIIACQVATGSSLPMQNQLDPRHLDLDPAAGGSGIFVAPGVTYEQSFGDALDSAEDWYAEFLIGNPIGSQPVAFDMNLVWPGGDTQGPGLLQPGFAFVLKVNPTDIPETRPNWLFTFTNPTSQDLIVDASVSEALSLTTPPETSYGFFTLAGEPAGSTVDNRFTPGDIGPNPVRLGIVPEPTAFGLALVGACLLLAGGYRSAKS